ncbi:thioredoxin-like protein [Lutibacter sp. Hel_I_33_5]|uniref:thioredoxin family protein n=1 Tax=Lutibacter sp. Hel_I_33_5 TaxID=1566289 RepID=UPI00119EE0C1|nr:thioredoxin family protein [Lutibacter sp. Hel_I_33_5]TVZ57115.1 thioredoxin-like protein [Lutibacter sp. Hel_I_33_5]
MKLKLITLFFIASIFTTHVKAQETALRVLQDAITQAKVENKNIFIKYSASWCGWCRVMDKKIKSRSCKDLFDSNYVMVTLVAKESPKNKNLENPGAFELLKIHNGEKSGLPFWAILNNSGEMIKNSLNKNGRNLGCPGTKDEVLEFINILRTTSSLSEKNLKIIAEKFL